jgi:hypothetical protein
VRAPVLYSTNVFLKFHINERFLKGVHYVWCSETFDSSKQGHYVGSALTAPSSDPCAIYKQLLGDITRSDRHSAKLTEQKASLQSLAVMFESSGRITHDEAEEIIYMAEHATAQEWRPLIYVIPRDVVQAKLKLVSPAKRASIGVEYIIEDLARNEFDIIEL